MSKKRKIIFILIILFIAFIFLGEFLDYKTEKDVYKQFKYTEDGYIKDCKEIKMLKSSDKALVLFHGVAKCSSAYKTDLVMDIFNKTNPNLDIYSPTLPYHGKTINELNNFEFKKIEKFIESYINALSKKYKKVTIGAVSMSGLATLDLLYKNKIPKNTKVILVSPAIFISSNKFISRNIFKAYYLWRNYYNWDYLGAFPIVTMAPVIGMMDKDLYLREKIKEINYPFTLIIAKDDSRLNAENQIKECDKNKNCTKEFLLSGSHEILWTDQAKWVINYFLQNALAD